MTTGQFKRETRQYNGVNAAAHREQLYDAFATSDADVEAQIDEALAVGAEYLGLPIGFFTRIDDGQQEIVQAVGDHDLIQPGERCPLDEAYCRRTVELDETVAIQEVSAPTISGQAIETFGLGTYLGTTVVVDGEVHGTVCFADDDDRAKPFSESEELFVELLAKLVGSELDQRAYEQELRARNETLRQEKERFEGIAETSFDILFRVDDTGKFTYVSSAVERVLGRPPEAVIGESLTANITESAANEAMAAYGRLLEGEHVEDIELEFFDVDGDRVILEVNATPLMENGEIVGVQGVGRDITERKQREEELRIKNRAIDDADLGVAIADPDQPDNPLVYVNAGFERLTGYTADEMLGRNCRFLQGAATDDEAVAELRAAVETETGTTVELVNYRADGTPFWNHVQLNPVFDDCGTLTHYLGFQTDVTERRRTEQLIELLNRVLRHNLRNDMSKVMGFADLISSGGTPTPQAEAARIAEVASDLVDLSEHARDLEKYAHIDREPERLDPTVLLTRLVATHRDRCPAAEIDVSITTDREICAGAELDAAVSEAITNAIKHNPAAEPAVSVTVHDDEEWVVIEVADDGPGIDPMEAEVISTGSETALEHGSGLGLWLINWIVTRYGGALRIDGGPNGTTATLRLPALDDGATVDDVARPPTVLFR